MVEFLLMSGAHNNRFTELGRSVVDLLGQEVPDTIDSACAYVLCVRLFWTGLSLSRSVMPSLRRVRRHPEQRRHSEQVQQSAVLIATLC